MTDPPGAALGAPPGRNAGKVSGGVSGGAVLELSQQGWKIRIEDRVVPILRDAAPEESSKQSPERSSGQNPEHIVETLEQLLRQVPAASRRCVLAVPASECFFVDFDLPASVQPKDRDGVTFELERLIPLDAEEMVNDYFVSGPSRVSAIAIEIRRYRELIDAIEQAAIQLVSIIPSSLLVARGVQQWRGASSPYELVLVGESSHESLSIGAGGPRRWKHCFGDAEQGSPIRDADREIAADAETTVVVGRRALPFAVDGPVVACKLSTDQLLADGANIALSGRWGGWMDLRRGAFAPPDPLHAVAGPLRTLAIAAAVCCLVVVAAATYRGTRIDDETESIRRQQRDAFQESFPDRRPPVMLMRSVRNEHRRALGSRGHGNQIDLPVPATSVLNDLLVGLRRARVDGGIEFRLIDIDVLDGECSLTVRTKDSVQLGSIAKALEDVGFEVQPPATLQIDPSKDEPLVTYQSKIVAVWDRSAEPDGSGR